MANLKKYNDRRGLGLTENGFEMLGGTDLDHERVERLIFRKEHGLIGKIDGSLVPDFLYNTLSEATAQDILSEIEFLIANKEPTLDGDEARISISKNSATGNDGIKIEIDVSKYPSEENETLTFFKVRDVSTNQGAINRST